MPGTDVTRPTDSAAAPAPASAALTDAAGSDARSEDSALPLSVYGMGYAGLLPFVASAAMLWLGEAEFQNFMALALVTYAALITSFLGGIHWGLALRGGTGLSSAMASAHLAWGIFPPLVAWSSLLMLPRHGLPLCALLLAGCYVVDRSSWPRLGMGRWLPLRLQLSVVAALCCGLGAAAL